jgi:hypothetical protein
MVTIQLKQRIINILPDVMADLVFAIWKHKRKHGVFPNIVNPITFNEKVLYRKLFDHRKILTQFADKYGIRQYIEKRLGAGYLPKLYCVTNKPSDILIDELPDKFVVKPTHGSGWVSIITDKSKLNKADLIKTCNSWLSQSIYKMSRDKVYKNIEPRIIVEEFINDGSDGTPNDYKFFVFHGKVELIQIDVGRFTEHRRNLYSRSWKKLDLALEYKNIAEDVKRPKHLDEMIIAAEILGAGIDFIRADFYDTEEKPYFGEITTTPGCGFDCFKPSEFDRYLGGLWILP